MPLLGPGPEVSEGRYLENRMCGGGDDTVGSLARNCGGGSWRCAHPPERARGARLVVTEKECREWLEMRSLYPH